ncbi:MAG: TonB-dependent receptor plug domain-containing protein [Opitutaceae bacterium]|nr:TonB-dependent receptor plug domain-containing protein [Opitutaceae bacterium]
MNTTEDRGYRSVYSAGGSLVSVELSTLPSSITVLNNELIKDTGVTDLFELSRYATGTDWHNIPFNETQYDIRGINNEHQSRNFFIWYIPTDTFSVERVEVLRGPNALLYGTAAPGGLMNIVTKRAEFKNAASATMSVGSWERRRAEVDVNRKVNDKLALRVNLAVAHSEDFRDFRKSDFWGAHVAGTFQPFAKTRIRFEGEVGRLDRNIGTVMLSDNFSSYDPAVSATAGTTVRTGDANNYYISYDGRTVTRYGAAGFRRSEGTTLVMDQTSPYFSLVPREYQFQGPTPYITRNYSQWAMTVEQTLFDKLNLEATVNRQNSHNDQVRGDTDAAVLRRDPNPLLPDGSPNPNLNELYVDHRHIQFNYRNWVTDLRLAASYNLELPLGIEQRLVGMWTHRHAPFEGKSYQERSTDDLRVLVYRRKYVDEYESRDHTWNLLSGQTRLFGVGATWAKSVTDLSSRSIAAIGKYWDGRIHTVVGHVRHELDVERQRVVTAARSVPGGGTVAESVGYTGIWAPDATLSADNINYGAVIDVLRNFNGMRVSLVGNYAEAFRPSGQDFSVLGGILAPLEGEGREFGIRIEAFEGKAALSFTHFDIGVNNTRSAVPQNVRDQINSMFGAGTVIPTGIGPTGDTISLNSRGHEVELTLNPVPNWTLMANYSHVDLRQSDVFPFTRPFWERARAENRPLAEYNLLNNLISPAVTNAQFVAPEREHSVNVFTRYAFRDGKLKGLVLGGGLNYRGEAYLGIVGGQYYFTPDFLIANLLLGYSTKVAGFDTTFSLNINNVTNEVTYTAQRLTSAQWDRPRDFRLSASVKF